jgi:hypothetical protein
MRKYIAIFVSLIALVLSANAQTIMNGSLAIDKIEINRSGEHIIIDMDINLSQLKLKSSQAVLITPVVVNGDRRLELTPIGIYGRENYINNKRTMGDIMLGGTDEIKFRKSEMPDVLNYQKILAYQSWMNGAMMIIEKEVHGCCDRIDDRAEALVGGYEEFIYKPEFIYVTSEGEAKAKVHALEGSAMIDFPIGMTRIIPTYGSNRVEIDKIVNNIKSVSDDKDAIISNITITGYASPDGPYGTNERLARERTMSLKNYVSDLLGSTSKLISTSYVAEDWEGFRAKIAASHMTNRDAILSIIDSEDDLDLRERKIRQAYPRDFNTFKETIFPALRRTNYKVEYEIRTYTDVEEIKSLVRTAPQKLSLQEFYLAASEMQSGGDEFDYIFETAARMFPEDEIANLNAANASMSKGNLRDASSYLTKAGNSAEADYARGVLAALNKEYATAIAHLRKASDAGLAKAAKVIAEIEKVGKNVFRLPK